MALALKLRLQKISDLACFMLADEFMLCCVILRDHFIETKYANPR